MTLLNQSAPIGVGKDTLLTCDLWEHAYYLKYRHRRAVWLKEWWEIVDWEDVGERFVRVVSGCHERIA
jgi:Fe-Mn family superoxide dismutase